MCVCVYMYTYIIIYNYIILSKFDISKVTLCYRKTDVEKARRKGL